MDPFQKFQNIINGHCNFIEDVISDILDELSVKNYKKKIEKSIFFQEMLFPLKTLKSLEDFEEHLKNKVLMEQNVYFIFEKLKLKKQKKCTFTIIRLIMNFLFETNLIKTFSWTGRIRKQMSKLTEINVSVKLNIKLLFYLLINFISVENKVNSFNTSKNIVRLIHYCVDYGKDVETKKYIIENNIRKYLNRCK